MATTAYGSITIVDIGDLGELSITPTSNQPSMVICDPNGPNGPTYSPDWSTSNLLLTPVVYYGGTALVDADHLSPVTGLTVTWYKQGSSTAISTNYQLTVNTNVLANVDYVTYIARASYTEPNSGVQLQAEGQISFSKVTNASQIKTINITGDSTFLTSYDNDNISTVSPSSITLTANTQYYSDVIYWYYQNGNNWTSAGTGSTKTIQPNDAGFVNSSKTATYRATSASTTAGIGGAGEIFDIHTIVKVSDGTNGSNGTTTKSVILSNEDEMVPFTSSTGTGDYTDCNTSISVFDGATDITTDTTKCRIFIVSRTASQVASATVYTNSNTTGYLPVTGTTTGLILNGTNVVGSWTPNTQTCAITSLTADTGRMIFYVYFNNEGTWELITNKKFGLVKVYPGQDGQPATIYKLNLSSITTTHGADTETQNTYSPSSITLSAQQIEGSMINNYTSAQYLYSVDGGTEQRITTSTGTLTFGTGTGQLLPQSTITIKLVASGTSTPVLDSQTITVITDGATGAQGPSGEEGQPALSLVLGNYGDQIPCSNDGKVAGGSGNITKTIDFKAFIGVTENSYCKAYVSSGTISNSLTTNATGSANARVSPITVTYGNNTTLGDADQGTLSIVVTSYTDSTYSTAQGSQTFTYTWVKNKQAKDGKNAIIFQLYSSSGNTIVNKSGSIDILPTLNDGATDTTSSGNYTWYYWSGSDYTQIVSGQGGYTITTGSSPKLNVAAEAVSTYVSIKCACSYNNSTYNAYFSVYDKTDAFQVEVLSTIGDKLVNSVGTGIIYTKVTKNGVPYDEIKTTKLALINNTASPSSAAINTACNAAVGSDTDLYCWLAIIYGATKELRLYSRTSSSGTTWTNVTTDPHLAQYTWVGTHADGAAATIIAGLSKAKAILVNGDIINKKTIFNVTMTVNS